MEQISTSTTVRCSLGDLPDELISQLLYYLPPLDNLDNIQLVSQRFRSLANEPLLWRYYCKSAFKHWNVRHNLREKLKHPVDETDWKSLFLQRIQLNDEIGRLFDAIINTKVHRIRRIEVIAQFGYDAKDFLTAQCQSDPTIGDGLARKYYGRTILGSIHRSAAIAEWRSLQQSPHLITSQVKGHQLERLLGSFDLFVLGDEPGDLEDITEALDTYAARFRDSQPYFGKLSTRQKALTLLRWLRAQNFAGVRDPERNYRNLRNCLIGQVLRHEDHQSIPIISSAIYCCIASRLGIDARCIAFPSHVHVAVYPNPGHTLDSTHDLHIDPAGTPPESMFLDPYGNDNEVPEDALRSLLAQLNIHTNADAFLSPVSALSVVLRTAQNIKVTLSRILNSQGDDVNGLTQLIGGDSKRNVEACLYSASWATIMLTPPHVLDWSNRLTWLLRRFVTPWPEDAWLVEKYLLPMHTSVVGARDVFPAAVDDPWQHWQSVREQDGVLPRVFRRKGPSDATEAPFKIGQVFRHKRYGWTGVITGWSDQRHRLSLTHGHLGLSSVSRQLGFDRLYQQAPRSLNTFYFMCLPSHSAEPNVVASHSIDIVTDAVWVKDDMFPTAGKFFKRFDKKTCSYVSNIREQFPDD